MREQKLKTRPGSRVAGGGWEWKRRARGANQTIGNIVKNKYIRCKTFRVNNSEQKRKAARIKSAWDERVRNRSIPMKYAFITSGSIDVYFSCFHLQRGCFRAALLMRMNFTHNFFALPLTSTRCDWSFYDICACLRILVCAFLWLLLNFTF